MNKTEHKITHTTVSRKQELFLRYFTMTLIDLTVLNLVAEYWDRISISSFWISLLIAITLQILLKMTIFFEHYVAEYFNSNASLKMKILRVLSAWAILFFSKLIILEVLQFIFSDAIVFTGAYHGLIAFIVLVAAILFAEFLLVRFYKSLA